MKKIYITVFLFLFVVFTASSQGVDIGITAIVDPVPGTSIPNNYNDTIKFSMINNGPTIAANDTIPIGFSIDGLPILSMYASMQSDFPTGVTAIVAFYGIDMGVLGLTNGDHTFCFWTQMPGDINNSNDTACATYTLVDPTVPTSLEFSLVQEYVKMYFDVGMLYLDVSSGNLVDGAELVVCDMMGRNVHSEYISGVSIYSENISFENYPRGVYLVSLRSNTGWVETRKLYLK